MSSRSASALALGCAVALPVLAPWIAQAGPPEAVGASQRVERPPMEIAVVDELSWSDRSKLPIAIQRAKDLGATWWRMPIGWDGKASTFDPAYGAAVDAYAAPIMAAGFGIQVTLSSSCFGAKAGEGGAFVGEDQIDHYVEWVGSVVQYFKGRFKRYSFWCEPNGPCFMLAAMKPTLRPAMDQVLAYEAISNDKTRTDADRQAAVNAYMKIWNEQLFEQNALVFREIYTRCAAKTHQVDPAAKVWLGELANNRGFDFLARVVVGQHLVADGLAIHPYQFTTPPERKPPGHPSYVGIGHVEDLQRVLANLAERGRLRTPEGKKVPLYCTEFGYRVEGSMGGISEAKRAAWMPRAYEFAARAGVRQMLHYPLFPSDAFPEYKGLLDRDGNPYPAYYSLQKWVRKYQARMAAR